MQFLLQNNTSHTLFIRSSNTASYRKKNPTSVMPRDFLRENRVSQTWLVYAQETGQLNQTESSSSHSTGQSLKVCLQHWTVYVQQNTVWKLITRWSCCSIIMTILNIQSYTHTITTRPSVTANQRKNYQKICSQKFWVSLVLYAKHLAWLSSL